MVKPSKKAAAVVAAEVPMGKAGKKREAEDKMKAVGAKKRKAAPPAKVVAPRNKGGKKAQKQPPPKKVDSSSSEEESGSESEEEVKVQAKKSAKPVNQESSDDRSDVSSEPDQEKTVMAAQSAKRKDDSSGPSDSDDSSYEEPSKKKQKETGPSTAVGIAKKDSSSDEADDDDSDDEEEDDSDDESDEEECDKTPMKDPKTPVTTQSQATASKTLYMGNAPYKAEFDQVQEFFKEAGEVIDVRFPLREDGRRKGFCYVEFASLEAAQKAIKFNGTEFMSRLVKLEFAAERGEYTPRSGNDTASFQKPAKDSSFSVFIRGFDKSLPEDEIRSSLEQHFAECGEITRVAIPTDNQSGTIKGIAYMDFMDMDSLSKALELRGSHLGGSELYVDQANARAGSRGGGGGGRSGGRFGGRSGGRHGGGRSGGRRGGGRSGRGGRFGGRNSGRG